ncbi:hypothetical protein [Nocardia sp. NPDC058497]|uniref:hypothetical protein n=1 Tax=Nocardia sp. NPDC058497 TaxID=3346529 RepID=UPI0036507F4D
MTGRSRDGRYVAELFGALSGLEDAGLVCSVPLSQTELDRRASAAAPDPVPSVLFEADPNPSRADLVGALDAMRQAGWFR